MRDSGIVEAFQEPELNGLSPATNRSSFTGEVPQNYVQLSDAFSSVGRVEAWQKVIQTFR